ncbi:MAG TPA: preprotein translocase subunit YajC [Bacteroidales bacterium]|jgi:preprotein translocase subunit YajC|nr:preprotein translocase subunit YajC [Bacteroidales bacterium]
MSSLLSIVLMANPQGQGQANPWSSLIPLLLIMVVFYFFLIRPQMKRQKDLKNFRDSLKKGDHIITAGGIYGKINNITDNVITIDAGNNILLKVDKSAVLRDTSDVQNQQQ